MASLIHPSPKKILVRGVNWLGDAVMTTPALLRLREAYPTSQITLLTASKLADLWRFHSAVDVVETFEPGEGVWAISRRIRCQNYDWGIVFPNSPRSALELWLGGIPRRLGYSGKWRKFLLTSAIGERPEHLRMKKRSEEEIRQLNAQGPASQAQIIPEKAHHIYHYLHLVSHWGVKCAPINPQIIVTSDELSAAQKRFQLCSIPAYPLLALNPGAEYGPAKRWPAERFIATAVAVRNALSCRWVVLGGKADIELANKISEGIQNHQVKGPFKESFSNPENLVINLAGRTNLRELCAVMALSRVVLTNDTGPMHLAAAVGTPVIVPFGSTSPELTGPGLPGDFSHRLHKSSVPCSPCFLRECPIDFRCMESIGIEEIVRSVLAVASVDN